MSWRAPALPGNKGSLLYHGLLALLALLLLTGLYCYAVKVSPSLHDRYAQTLHELHEADAQSDSEILANRLGLSHNYDRLTLLVKKTRQLSAAATLDIPPFLAADDLAQVRAGAHTLQQALDNKAQLIDRFKRTNAILGNSLAYFPSAADELLDTANLPVPLKAALEDYSRQTLSYARAPGSQRRAAVNSARQKLLAQSRHGKAPKAAAEQAETGAVDTLVLHGDAILKYLPEVNELIRAAIDTNTGGLLDQFERTYVQGHGQAESNAGRFRKLLYLVGLSLTAYLVLTFVRLERTRKTLDSAYREVSRHLDAQLLAEEQLRLHSAAFQNAHDGIILADTKGIIIDANPAFQRNTGYDRDELIGQNSSIIKSDRHDAEFYASMWTTLRNNGSWQGEIWNKTRQGEVYPELLSISELRDNQGKLTHYVAVYADLSLLKAHDRSLREAVMLSEDAILLLDCESNRFIECNAAAVAMLHAASKQQLLDIEPQQLSPEYQPDGAISREKALEMVALTEKNRFHRYQWQHLRLDGEAFPVEVTMTQVQLAEKKLMHVSWRDLTEIKRAEQSLNRHVRALAMLSAGNQALVRSTDEIQLLEAMCKVAVEIGGYKMAWVGYSVDDLQKSVRPMAHAGCEEGYLERINISWGKSKLSNGPTGFAIRTGHPHVARDIQNDPRLIPWREEAAKNDFQSSIGLPLIGDGVTFGALTVYAEYPDAFDSSELPLLEEMAEDLSYGIMALRNDIIRRQSEQQRDKSYSLLQAALESTADGLLVTALDGEVESYNRRFKDMFAIPDSIFAPREARVIADYIAHTADNPALFMDTILANVAVPEAAYRDFFTLRDGRTIERITQPQYLNELIIGRVCSYRDITEQKRHEQQLVHLANHDALTGLPNRHLLNDRLEQIIVQSQRNGALVAALFFDIDHFKIINDSLGHDSGDLLLVQLAGRLPQCLREGDTVARMGGDEFVILIPGLLHEEDAGTVASKLCEVIANPYLIAGRKVFATASVGITLYPRDGGDAVTLLKHADAAMYRAKGQGGNCFQFFTSEINEQVARQFDLAGKLRHALKNDQFQLYYQPQIDLGSGRIVGAEALLRWQHPEMGMIPPSEFIPIAEETGVILALGEWVMASACAYLKNWQDHGLPAIKIAVNLSARQFDLLDLPETFARLLKESGVDASHLELEITEGMVMKHPDRAVQMLNELKQMGFSIAIDDFGTGYSSLGYLKSFPIDKLKIDRSFVQDIPDDKDDAAITRAVIAMAHELRLLVVAEGVETVEQQDFLQDHRCDLVQGYLTGRPMPGDDFAALLRTKA